MTDTEEAMRLTNTQKFYAKTALERLASEYEDAKASQHAANVRMLIARIDALSTQRRQPTKEESMVWQQKLLDCGQDQDKFSAVMLEWWHALLLSAIDPTVALVEALLSMLEQSSHHTAGKLLFTIEQKIIAVVEDPMVPEGSEGPDIVFKEILRFIHQGQAEAHAGKPLWSNDPHLEALARKIRQQHPPV